MEIVGIDKTNWEDAMQIKVKPNQVDFVPDVKTALATAYVEPWDEKIDAFGLKQDDKLVGFFYISYTPQSTDNYWLGGFQIDKNYQGRGYARLALEIIFDFMSATYPECQTLYLTLVPKNQVAKRLYETSGFSCTGKSNAEGEIIYVKPIATL